MMGYDYLMMGGGGMMFWGWLFYILLVALMVLGIAALWKYINKK